MKLSAININLARTFRMRNLVSTSPVTLLHTSFSGELVCLSLCFSLLMYLSRYCTQFISTLTLISSAYNKIFFKLACMRLGFTVSSIFFNIRILQFFPK